VHGKTATDARQDNPSNACCHGYPNVTWRREFVAMTASSPDSGASA
jgi:hypothetical protein